MKTRRQGPVTPPSSAKAGTTPGRKIAARAFGGEGGEGGEGGGGAAKEKGEREEKATAPPDAAAAADGVESEDDASSSDSSDSESSSDSSDSEASSDSDSDSDASTSDSDDDDDDGTKKKKSDGWNALDDATAAYVAKSVETHMLLKDIEAAEKAGTLFASEEEEKAFKKRAVKALFRQAAIDAAVENGQSVRQAFMNGVHSSTSKYANEMNSLFGGHLRGCDDLTEKLPEMAADRLATVDALPTANAHRKRTAAGRKAHAKNGGGGGGKSAASLLGASDPSAQGGVLSARELADKGAGILLAPLDKTKLRREAKKLGRGDAGRGWFNMPAVEYTPELRRDLRLLKLRGAYDPKRFYKTEDTTKLPKHFQVGTVIEGAQDFYSARLTKRARKNTLTEEIAADAEIKTVRKKRFAKIQDAHAGTMGRKHKRKLGGRARGGGGVNHGVKSTKRTKH